MAQRRSGDRLERHRPKDWVDDGIWRVMVCGPARAGASWICEAVRAFARHVGKSPQPANGRVEDATVRPLIGEAWLELEPARAWILRAHQDVTDLLFGWRLVVVHRDPRAIVAELRRVSGAPLPFLIEHVRLATGLVDTAARLPGCPVLIVPWTRLLAEPRAVLAELAGHLDVTADPTLLDQLLDTLGAPAQRLVAVERPACAADSAAEPADPGAEAAAVIAAVGPWMRRWGYPVPGRAEPRRRGRRESAGALAFATPAADPV